MPEIHTTDLTTFKECRRKWAISELARIRPVKLNMNLTLGSAVHRSLETWYRTDDEEQSIDALNAYFDEATAPMRNDMPWLYVEQEAEVLENIELGTVMMQGYFERYANEEFRVAKANGELLLEVDFIKPVLTPDGKKTKFSYAGTMDGLVRDEYGYWILEHKTTAYTSAEYLRLADQNVMYLAHAQVKWPKIVPLLRGVHYNFLRKQAPSPRVKSPLFFRERIYRNQHEIDSAVNQIYYVCMDMQRVAKDPDRLAYPTPTKDCTWKCSYKTICQAMNDGTDVPSLLEANFMTEDESRSKWVSNWRPCNA